MENQIIAIYTFLFIAMFFAGFVVLSKSAIATNISLNMLSTSVAIIYFFLNAPDVSMTEVSIGVFLSTAIYLMTVRVAKVECFERSDAIKYLIFFICFSVLFIVVYSAFSQIATFGNVKIEGSGVIYLLSSYRDYQIPNVITTILASFRGFDTMGETIIILTSSFGVYSILSFKNGKYKSL